MTRLAAILLILLTSCCLTAQEAPGTPSKPETKEPEPKPEPIPDLPNPPYVKEHIAALEKHLEISKLVLVPAKEALKNALEAEKKEGISPEELIALKTVTATSRASVEVLTKKIEIISKALKGKSKFPTQAELDAQKLHDSKVARIKEILASLTLKPSDGMKGEEGEAAKTLRITVESYLNIRQIAKKNLSSNGKEHPLYEELSGLEKLDFRLRIAEENLHIAIRLYDALDKEVFEAFQAYETLAFEGLSTHFDVGDASTEAKIIAGLLNARQDSTKRRASSDEDILKRLNIHDFSGMLKSIQQDIDVREDLRDQLQSAYDKLKEIESHTKAPATTTDEAGSTEELEQYAVLSKQIDELKKERRDNEEAVVEAEKSIVKAQEVLDRKNTVVTDVSKLQAESEEKLKELRNAKVVQLMNSSGRKYKGRLGISVFKATESLSAEKERLLNAKRDSKAAQTDLDIQTKRKESFLLRNQVILDPLLPALRRTYYEELGKTIGWRAVKVILVLLFAWLFVHLTKWLGEPLIERFVRRSDEEDSFSADEKQRARTLMTVFMTTSRVVIYMLAIMFSIAQFDVNYGPLLVAAGGLSLAVGFGAQSLVKDFFSGFFILLEGQFSIGDVVEVGGKIGTVERLGLRTTVLRSLNGDVHVVPNGEITATTNMTKEWSRAVVDLGVAYEENTDDVTDVMVAVAEEMKCEKVWGRKLIEHLMAGVHELGDSAVTLRILLKTRAGEQWGVAREYQRRCKLKFDELGIEIPWPQMVMTNKSSGISEQEKKAKLERYVTEHKAEEDPEMEGMSVEERDRAEQLAKREANLTDDGGSADDNRDESELSDAEKWAKKQTTQMSASERRKRIEERSADSPDAGDEFSGDGDGD